MKTSIYTNCSLVRVPIKAGESEYYLPQNVDWASRKIDKIVICAPEAPCLDPFDGVTPVLTAADVEDLYINLYDDGNREIMHDVSYENILHSNNQVLCVDSKLNLSLCRLYFTTDPVADGTILLYVYYGTRTEEDRELPKRSMTVEFPLAANEVKTFRDIVNYYMHGIPATVKGMICWNYATDPAWITLRDRKLTYQMANIHSDLARPDMMGSTAFESQAQLFLLNDLDIDFDYSNIREAAGQASTQKITFLY